MKLNDEKFQTESKKALLEKILEHDGSSKHPKKHKKHIYWWYVSVAAIAIVFIIGGYLFSGQEPQKKEVIVGNKLNSEDIQLIVGDKTTTFAKNISVQVNEDGNVQVQQGSEEKIVDVAEHKTSRLITPFGKRSKIILSDGTSVWLNSGSELEFPSKFAKDKREIRIVGEGYMEVAKDARKPFIVHTPQFTVNVLGTKFNISAYENDIQDVVLVEGSVSLKASNNKEFTLSPNWKIQCALTPCANTNLPPEIFLLFAPKSILAEGIIFILVYLFLPTFILRTLSPVSSI